MNPGGAGQAHYRRSEGTGDPAFPLSALFTLRMGRDLTPNQQEGEGAGADAPDGHTGLDGSSDSPVRHLGFPACVFQCVWVPVVLGECSDSTAAPRLHPGPFLSRAEEAEPE